MAFRAVFGAIAVCFGAYSVGWSQNRLLGVVFAVQGYSALWVAASDHRKKRCFEEQDR